MCFTSFFNLIFSFILSIYSFIHNSITPFYPQAFDCECVYAICIFRRFFVVVVAVFFCHISAALKYDYSDKEKEVRIKKTVSICNATQKIFYVFHCVYSCVCVCLCVHEPFFGRSPQTQIA